jgi:hypothetical protein
MTFVATHMRHVDRGHRIVGENDEQRSSLRRRKVPSRQQRGQGTFQSPQIQDRALVLHALFPRNWSFGAVY